MRLFHASLGTALFLFGCQLGVQTGGSGGVIPASATESATENATDSGESTGSSTSSDTQTSTTTDAASKSATVTATHTSTGTGTNTATDSDTTPGAPEAGASGVLQKSDLKDNSVHLSWTAATGYPAFDLSYRLCVRPAGDDLTTVASLKAACDGGGGWQGVLGATLDQVVTGLSAKTDFAANVLVHASSGLESTYAVATFQTLVDQTPPVPGNGGVLSISDVTASNATVSWTAASDAETMAAKLEYHVCLRTAAFTVAADADANCRYLSGWSRGLT